MTLKYLSYYY